MQPRCLVSLVNIRQIKQVNRVIVRSFMAELQKLNYKKSSISRKITALKVFFKFITLKKVVESNPLLYIANIKKDVGLPNFLTKDEIIKLLNLSSNSKYKLLKRN